MPHLCLALAVLFPALAVAADSGGSRAGKEESHPTIDREEAVVGVEYHKFLLLRREGELIALHVMPDPRFGWDGINYRWYHLTDRSDKFFLPSPGKADGHVNPNVKTGSGDVAEGKTGSGFIEAGPLTVEWSKSDHDSGWLYFSKLRDEVQIYPEQFDRIADFSGKVDAEKWKSLR